MKTTNLLLLVSSIAFTLVLVASTLLYEAEYSCINIVGDGYAMGTDPVPIVIGQSCNRWSLIDNFAGHIGLSTLLAFAIATVIYFVAAIYLWRAASKLKRSGYLALFMIETVTIFLLLTFVVAQLMGGMIIVNQPIGLSVSLLGIVLSQTAAFLLIRAHHRRRYKSSVSPYDVRGSVSMYTAVKVLLVTVFVSTALLSALFFYMPAQKPVHQYVNRVGQTAAPSYLSIESKEPTLIPSYVFGAVSLSTVLGLYFLTNQNKNTSGLK